jgi:hypothetical protein
MANYELGPCQINYRLSSESAGAMHDLGKTFGGVTLSVEETYQQLKTDQDGTVPVDEWITGTTPKITAKLADITLENIALMFKTTVHTSTLKKLVDVTPNTGYSLKSNYVVITLKPYISGVPATNANYWITIPCGGIRATASLEYSTEAQRVIQFDITGYPDASNRVIRFGDTTVTY